MYRVLDKDIIEMEIVPHIPLPKRGFAPTVPLCEIVNAILYKMKSGVQWELLPVTALFPKKVLSWQSVYHHYRKWCLEGTFLDCWTAILKRHRDRLDLSSVDLDGSHTPCKRGGEAVQYQGRTLYLTDRQGLPLAMSEPVAGNRNDLYEIEVQFEVVTATLDQADIGTDGLFLNADAGFDSKDFRAACSAKEINANICFNKRNGSADDRDEYFDQDLYDERYAVERTNAWMDSFRSLLNRFDTTIESWKGFNYLSFIVLALRKFKMKKFK